MLEFLKEWGALCLSVLSLGVALLAYVTSRRAVEISDAEHDWKRRDREEAQARREWCERHVNALAESGLSHLPIDPGEIAWAKWGEEHGYFRLVFDRADLPVLVSRAR